MMDAAGSSQGQKARTIEQIVRAQVAFLTQKDLEDSIAPEQKVVARGITRGMLDARNPGQKLFIRINALDTGLTLGDLASVMPGRPDGIVRDGQCDVAMMWRNHVSTHDLDEDMRLGVHTDDLSSIRVARVERSGDVSFIKK